MNSSLHTPRTSSGHGSESPTPDPDGDLRHGGQPTPLDLSVTSHPPSSLSPGDHVFERTIIDSRTRFGIREVKAKYQRRVVEEIVRVGGEWQWHFRNRLPAGEAFVETLLSDAPDIRSYPPPRMPDYPKSSNSPAGKQPTHQPDWQCIRWECPPKTPPELDGSPKTLTFTHLSGDGSRRLVNRLLAGGPDGQFDHLLPGVQKWTDAFLASHDGHPYSVAVLGQPYNSDTAEGTGEHTVYLTRLCNHPCAPPNTSSWMLGRIRGWLRANTEVKKIVSLAGIDNNQGTVYEAAGFTHDESRTVVHPQYGEWQKHRWVDTIQ